jgi:hypothetical protein
MYKAPEGAKERADVMNAEGNWELALNELVKSLQNNKNKANNYMLEQIMVSIIFIF